MEGLSRRAPLKMNDVGVTWVTNGLVGEHSTCKGPEEGTELPRSGSTEGAGGEWARGREARGRGGRGGWTTRALDSAFTGEPQVCKYQKGPWDPVSFRSLPLSAGRTAGRRVVVAFTGPFLAK